MESKEQMLIVLFSIPNQLEEKFWKIGKNCIEKPWHKKGYRMKNQELLEQARKQKKKIVLVTGVFDVLHEEHKRFLEAARKEGDFLLIGIESDVRVRTMKGENRPYFSEEKRKDHLEAWNIANSVFILPEQFSRPADHDALIAQIRPDVLAVS